METRDRPISIDTQTVTPTGRSAMPFERELSVYKANLIELLANEGKFVVIYGDDIAHVPFETYDDALGYGYETYGLKPFLVKQITRGEPIHYLSRDLPACRP
jgi:hypothetical protein